MLTIQWFHCFSVKFGLALAIIVYFIRISWTCAIYREQQLFADCVGVSIYTLDLGATRILVHVAKLQT